MLPSELKSEYFSSYPPDAKRLAQEYIGTLRGLPSSFASGLLRELIDYDYKFPAERPSVPRLGIAVVGQGVDSYPAPLFRKLRPHGAYFSRVNPDNGLTVLLAVVAARARKHAASYAHWYIDGGTAAEHDSTLTCVSYAGLEPVRSALLQKMHYEL